jgi:hypothetical protein
MGALFLKYQLNSLYSFEDFGLLYLFYSSENFMNNGLKIYLIQPSEFVAWKTPRLKVSRLVAIHRAL